MLVTFLMSTVLSIGGNSPLSESRMRSSDQATFFSIRGSRYSAEVREMSNGRGVVATHTNLSGLLLVILALAQGCATPPKRNPPPENLHEKARVAGIPQAR